MVRRVSVVTTTRAEYGLLRPLMQALKESPEFELQLIVSGTHLAPEFGLTGKNIVEDGFEIDEQVDMLVSGDSPSAAATSLGLMTIGISSALRRLQPDLLILLGDRYEMLGVASAATIFNIPIAHLCGGEITKGAIDDSIRHAITKLSHLHFTSTEDYRRRVVQLGEPPDRVFNVGAIGLNNVRSLQLLDRESLAESLKIKLDVPYFLVTYHPVTAADSNAVAEVDALMEALLDVEGTQAIVTLGNADVGGRAINCRLEEWAARFPARLYTFASLGQLRYLSAIRHSLGVVGNSSSGIVEAPSLGVGTLNIGPRQEGRIQATSIVNCRVVSSDIRAGLQRLMADDFRKVIHSVHNPYENGDTVSRILKTLVETDFSRLISKDFYDVPVAP